MKMINDFPKQKQGVQTRYIGGETLLSDGERCHAINPPAAFVWNLCDGAHPLESIVSAIQAKFQIPLGTDLLFELNKILSDFKEKDLLGGDH